MTWTSCSRALLLLALVVATARTTPSAARPPDRVQTLIDEAQQLFKGRQYREALAFYRRAHAKSGEWRLIYMMARCHEELAELEAAQKLFEMFLGGDLQPAARAKAEEGLARIRANLRGRIAFDVTPGARVRLDGEVIGVAPLEPAQVVAGKHVVVATLAGLTDLSEEVRVPPGAEVRVTLAFPPRPPPRATSPWSWIALSGGAALMATGAVLFALGESDHQEAVDGGVERPGPQPRLNMEEAYGLIASGDDKKMAGYVLLGVGGAALIGSAVLFAVDGSDGDGEVEVITVAPLRGGALLGARLGF